ncbi:MAG: hypothetical protein ACP5M9_03730 [Candidatus Micrarchaeia archaeon]
MFDKSIYKNYGEFLRRKQTKEDLARSYHNSGINSLKIIIEANGKEEMAGAVVDVVRDNYVKTFEDLLKVRDKKREKGVLAPSDGEMLFGVALLQEGISYCFDKFRVFSNENKGASVRPDFVTNIMVDNKLVFLEVHPFVREKMAKTMRVEKRNRVKERVDNWRSAINSNGFFLIFSSNLKKEVITNKFECDFENFADVYIALKKNAYLYMNGGSEEILKFENILEDKVSELKVVMDNLGYKFLREIFEKHTKHYLTLRESISRLKRDRSIRVLKDDEFFDYMKEVTIKQIDNITESKNTQ